jgi:hypothetical protein
MDDAGYKLQKKSKKEGGILFGSCTSLSKKPYTDSEKYFIGGSQQIRGGY